MANGKKKNGDDGAAESPKIDEEALSRWPLRDLVTSYKGCLKRKVGDQAQAQRAPLPRLPVALIDTFKSRPSANMYPYTKGPDFGNEGLGYGDLVRVKLLIRDASSLQPVPHIARRTRSGITPLEKNSERFLDEAEDEPKT